MIYHNLFSIAFLLGLVNGFFMGLYMITLKGRSLPTIYMGRALMSISVLNLGFFWGPLALDVTGAYHRYLTVFGAAVALCWLVQTAYHFPRNTRPRESRVVFAIMACGAAGIVGLFLWQTQHEEPWMDFGGHTYQFSRPAGVPSAIFIVLSALWYIGVVVRQQRGLKGPERQAAILLGLSFLLNLLPGAVLNALRQAGKISPEIFVNIYAVGTLLCTFAILMVFINSNIDRTSFMVKIIGISALTVLLMMQAVSTTVLGEEEVSFDANKNLEVENIVGRLDAERSPVFRDNVLYVTVSAYSEDAGTIQPSAPRLVYVQPDWAAHSAQIQRTAATPDKSGFHRRYHQYSLRDLAASYRLVDRAGSRVVEVGFPYREYRAYIDRTAAKITYITIALLLCMLIIFPLFFSVGLVKPLNKLLAGVKEVNEGNLQARIPILVRDEIGFLSDSFNGMVQTIGESRDKLQEYAETLEEKVIERTAALNESLTQVNELKVQQDGDYFLTSLLIKPLSSNNAKSKTVSVDFLVRQKKQFVFRQWQAEIGGDICISDTIELHGQTYTVFMNADAMGKSIQGAGGALVLGVVFKSVIARTQQMGTAADQKYPEQWIKECFIELQNIFVSFDGSMLLSCVLGLIDDASGLMYYLNAEHPWTVLYRSGKAAFLESEMALRKIGMMGLDGSLQIRTFQLEAGDVIILGSDGRDDILTGEASGGARIINEDEALFLKNVEVAQGDLTRLENAILAIGELTDDLSLVRLGFKEDHPLDTESTPSEDFAALMERGRLSLENDDPVKAQQYLEQAHAIKSTHPDLVKMLADVYLRTKNYARAAEFCEDYTFLKPSDASYLYLASYCYKMVRDYKKSADLGERYRLRNPEMVKNLVNLADVYRLIGNAARAQMLVDKALTIDPESEKAQKLRAVISTAPRA